MSLYRPYTPEPVISGPHPDGLLELSGIEALSKMLEENITRLLGVPKRLSIPEDFEPTEK